MTLNRSFSHLWDDIIAWLYDLKCDVEENSKEVI